MNQWVKTLSVKGCICLFVCVYEMYDDAQATSSLNGGILGFFFFLAVKRIKQQALPTSLSSLS